MLDVRVNPTCEVYWDGARHGAGAELKMPEAEAMQKQKDGVVTILSAPKKKTVINKENDHAG